MTAREVWAAAMTYDNRADPYPFFDELRKTPVVQVADDLYVVTGYRELLALAHDPRISSDIRRSPLRGGQDPEVEDLGHYGHQQSIIVSDPPDHDRARRQVMRHFGPPHSPGVIPATEPSISALCNRLLDGLKANGSTRFDVVNDYAYPVPVMVICRILGVPLQDEPTFHAWIYDMLSGLDLGPDAATDEGRARVEKGRTSGEALRRYLAELIDGYLHHPADCLLSNLVNDTDGPDGAMSPQEALSNAQLLLIAGHDSTVNTISNCVLTLLRNPGSFDLLRQRPELIPRAIEEVQRLQSAVQFFPSRSATDDIEIAGTVIRKGAAVHLMYSAANRDPARFPDPGRFDPQRPDNEHFGWGSGIHTCMGGPLARLEVNLALETFLRRADNPRLVVDPPPYRRSQIFRGPLHLPVEVDGIRD
ncbi:cytochrome P450 [Mycobacterium camsae]|uniref:cytochrome P450 n=1 Tax=Mycobacterium gordonae TaxID=1778 RepID=UPI00197CF0A8|nr:cytochrome P450 [Mycobacterium gordonae]